MRGDDEEASEEASEGRSGCGGQMNISKED